MNNEFEDVILSDETVQHLRNLAVLARTRPGETIEEHRRRFEIRKEMIIKELSNPNGQR